VRCGEAIAIVACIGCGGGTTPESPPASAASDGGSSSSTPCPHDASASVAVTAGGVYDPYEVSALSIDGAPSGTYTFAFLGPCQRTIPVDPSAATVMLQRNGVDAIAVTYSWQTTVSDAAHGLSHAFEFPGYLELTVRKTGTGTINLFDLPDSLFDGAHAIDVP